MLILRFQKVGKKKDYTYRVVAVDSRFSSKSGKVKEVLGWWQPKTDKFSLDKERVDYWLKQGAQISDSCYNLLVKAKIIEGKKRPIKIGKKKAKEGKRAEGEKLIEQGQVKSEEPIVEVEKETGKESEGKEKGTEQQQTEATPREKISEPEE
ncbi:MAG: 30S ribosomal protein S16 [Candidatus Pacebacteria bacterium]|nr:30S ribosomal protein S16 [Candidatus Paceibacterota bacterium]